MPGDRCLNSKSESIALPRKFPIPNFPSNLRSLQGYYFTIQVIYSAEEKQCCSSTGLVWTGMPALPAQHVLPEMTGGKLGKTLRDTGT